MSHYVDLVVNALPNGLTVEEFFCETPAPRDDKHAMDICTRALIQCKRIDWDKYLEDYPDVKIYGFHPLEHFIKYGMFEKRKLSLKHTSNIPSANSDVAISIIAPNFNNALYLPQSIGGVLSQSFKPIEIIVIDDGSTDNSVHILREMQKADSRLKLIEFNENQSQHMARKAGVAAACGKFIMFLDTDDFFLPDALKRAYDIMQSGCDVGAFNADILVSPYGNASQDQKLLGWINAGESSDYQSPDIMPMIFQKRNLSSCIWTKIYKTHLVKWAFSEMEDGKYPRGQDEYEVFVMLSLAKSLRKVDDRLYVYRLGVGVSTPSASKSKMAQFSRTGDVISSLKAYANTSGYTDLADMVIPAFIRKSMEAWLDYIDENCVTDYFDNMATQYGLIPLMTFIINNCFHDWQRIARRFQYYDTKPALDSPVRRIGLIFSQITDGGAENVLVKQINLLAESGFEITLFLGSTGKNDGKISAKVKIIRLEQGEYDRLNVIRHLADLQNCLRAHPQDVMFFHESWSSWTLWQCMICKYAHIPVIVFQHSAFYRRFLYPELAYGQRELNSVLRCADKVLCLSREGELYYRQIGINAKQIFNPVPISRANHMPFKDVRNSIIVMGRFGEQLKQVNDCLDILADVARRHPNVVMTFLGSFNTDEAAKAFAERADAMNLAANVRLAGWVNDPGPFLERALVLLSTSYTEAFPLSIAEALATGVPVVAYTLGITLERNNDAIIQVGQGNKKAAAREILRLMSDENLWCHLSDVAITSVQPFNIQAYRKMLLDILTNFRQCSEVTYYNESDYQSAIRILGYYVGQKTPWT